MGMSKYSFQKVITIFACVATSLLLWMQSVQAATNCPSSVAMPFKWGVASGNFNVPYIFVPPLYTETSQQFEKASIENSIAFYMSLGDTKVIYTFTSTANGGSGSIAYNYNLKLWNPNRIGGLVPYYDGPARLATQPWRVCPDGYTMDLDGAGRPLFTCSLVDQNLQTCPDNSPPEPNKELGCKNPVTNPCNAATGNKYQQKADYRNFNGTLKFDRNYNSQLGTSTNLGQGWGSTIDRRLEFHDDNLGNISILFHRPDGFSAVFNHVAPPGSNSYGNWVGDPDVTFKLTETESNFILTTPDDTRETYSWDGRILSETDRARNTTSYNYDTNNKLISITNHFGQSLSFAYDVNGRLSTLTDPANQIITYSYDANNNLTGVSYPDGSSKTYHYEDANFPNHLTGITDENNNRYATWSYDTQGRATSSQHAGGVDNSNLVYNADGTTSVTSPLGNTRTYHFTDLFGVKKITQIDGQPCPNCNGQYNLLSYDANGFLASRTDFIGNTTTFINDTRGLQTSRTEAFITPDARTITTAWHGTFRLPTLITEPGKTTAFNYDANGNLLTRTETDTATNTSRTTTTTYTAQGLVNTIDGPRTAVSDITTFAYDASGNLIKVTNALSQVTNITAHDAHGRPLTLVDPNNVSTTLTYDLRGRLLTRTVGGQITTFAYDNVGNLTQLTLPTGAFIQYTYDAAQRLIGITDNLGNKIDYTLDAAGNRTKDDVKDPLGILTRTQSRVFNSLSQLTQILGGVNQTTSYAYDANGNPITITDGLNQATGQAFDALNRLTDITDAANGLTQYSYDARDNLTSATDPKGVVTNYVYDGLDNLTQQVSPDTGTTNFTHDSAGNVLSQTDARGIIVNFTYDALNRLTTKDFVDNSLDVTLSYDTCPNGVGRLCQMSDASGITSYAYDARGNVIQTQAVMDGITTTIGYAYNGADQVTQITYPSTRAVDYTHNSVGQINSVASTFNSVIQPLASNLTYQPFGPVNQLTYGNGFVTTRSYDLEGRLVQTTLPQANTPPTANAGPDQTVNTGVLVNLDGTSSSDSDGTITSYSWTQTAGTTVTLTGANTITASFTAPTVTTTTILTFQLTVTDDQGATANDTINITVNAAVGRGFVFSTSPDRSSPVTLNGATVSGNIYAFINPATDVQQAWFFQVVAGNWNQLSTDNTSPFDLSGGTTTTANPFDTTILAEGPATLAVEMLLADGSYDLITANITVGGTSSLPPSATSIASADDTNSLTQDVILSSRTRATAGLRQVAHHSEHVANDEHGAVMDFPVDPRAASDGILVIWPAKAQSGTNASDKLWYAGPDTQQRWIPVNSTDTLKTLPPTLMILGKQSIDLWRKSPGLANYTHQRVKLEGVSKLATTPGPRKVSHTTPNLGQPAPAGTRTYGYDANGNIINFSAESGGLNTFNYDALNRLVTETLDGHLRADYFYDANGNRNSFVQGTTTRSYTYQTGSNILTNIDSASLTHDALGNRTSDQAGNRTFTYNDAGRLSQVRVGGLLTATYTYNGLGQRVKKVTASATTYYHYDLNGQLIGETSTTGATQREYVHLNGEPIAQMDVSGVTESITYLHPDHLGTPRRGTDATGTLVWYWESEAFGEEAASGTTTVNLRFPGQYFDQETGLHQNYFRYYDPATGRYITSDPIGLAGGLNTYAYALNNPLKYVDPNGLEGIVLGDLPGGNIPITPPVPLPPDSDYGPGNGNCNHYPAGSVLRGICENSGDDPNTNCARKCLKDKYPGGSCSDSIPPITDPWYWRDHPDCWSKCNWFLDIPSLDPPRGPAS